MKKMGASYNDFFMAVCTVVMTRFFEKKGYKGDKNLQVFIPFSLRPQGDHRHYNAVSSLVFPIKLETDFEKALKHVKKEMNKMKNSSQPFAFRYMNMITCQLPLVLQQPVFELMISKATCIFTNAPGPREDIEILGTKLIQAQGFAPFLGELGVGVVANGISNRMSIGVSADVAITTETKEIVRMFEEEYERFIKGE